MARYIDADALKEHTKSYTGMFTDEGFMVNLEAVLHGIDFQPALDHLRPKGWWVCLEPEIGYFACSECDHRILRAKCNFCPNCGADMRGGGEDG